MRIDEQRQVGDDDGFGGLGLGFGNLREGRV